MAIAFDSSTQASTTGTASPLTFSHTTSGSDRFLLVSSSVNTGNTISGITYGGTAMTLVSSVTGSAGPKIYLYYLVNPTSGSNNVVVTGSSTIYATDAVSYTGVDQTTPVNNSNSGAGSITTSFTTTLTNNVANSWMASTTRCASGSALTAGSGTTIRQQPEAVALGSGAFYDSSSALATGSQSLNVTSANQLYDGYVSVAFSPATGGGGGAVYHRLALTGVGN